MSVAEIICLSKTVCKYNATICNCSNDQYLYLNLNISSGRGLDKFKWQ